MTESLLRALLDTADAWSDPDHPPRQDAVEQTLDADNRFTEESVAFAINHAMNVLDADALSAWERGETRDKVSNRPWIGVLPSGTTPMDGFRELVCSLVAGARFVGARPDASPVLLSAFVSDLQSRHDDVPASFAPEDVLFERADGLVAHPDDADARAALIRECDDAGLPASRRLIRRPTYSVAILDGHASEDEREALAEDALLHQGFGRRRAAVIWAPEDLSPDPYFRAMAQFRAVFPVHEDTPGALQMQQAFLEARDEPHAHAAGMEFLISRGAPEPQAPSHLRWSEYASPVDVIDWIVEHRADLYAVTVRDDLRDPIAADLPEDIPVVSFGSVHRPPLDDSEGQRLKTFLDGVLGQDR